MRQSDPFRELERLLDRMNRRVEGPQLPKGGDGGEGSGMNVDVVDQGDEFVVTAAVPGFETDDIDVQLIGDSIQISASRDESTEESDEQYIRRERTRRSISRSIELPESVDEDQTSAKYNNGILTVRLPKADPATQGRSIEID